MSRYTSKQLQKDLEVMSRELIASGSTYTLQLGHRNGYTAVDIVRIDETGRARLNGLEQGTPRECYHAARLFVTGHKGYIFPQKRADLTRIQAKLLLQRCGIDFGAPASAVPWPHGAAVIETWAKLTRYRAPSSLARYFFDHLVKT